MNKIHFLIFISFAVLSCSTPSLEKVGGIELIINTAGTGDSAATVSAITQRLSKVIPYPETLKPIMTANEVKLRIVGYTDTVTVRQLSEWNRGMKLCYAVPASLQEQIRTNLAEYLSFSKEEKPFKTSSMIGLVEAKNKGQLVEEITSSDFKEKFPSAGQLYWGNKLVDNKHALFIEDKMSVVIDENMFESVEPFADKDGKEGIIGLKLKPEYSDRIGELTGNDSIYLLHILHEEVYISKIIETHITDQSFSMSGAFTPQDALVISTIWNSNELFQTPAIKSMKIISPE